MDFKSTQLLKLASKLQAGFTIQIKIYHDQQKSHWRLAKYQTELDVEIDDLECEVLKQLW